MKEGPERWLPVFDSLRVKEQRQEHLKKGKERETQFRKSIVCGGSSDMSIAGSYLNVFKFQFSHLYSGM